MKLKDTAFPLYDFRERDEDDVVCFIEKRNVPESGVSMNV